MSHGFLWLRPLRPLRSDSLLSAVIFFGLCSAPLTSCPFSGFYYSGSPQKVVLPKFIHFFCCVNFFINFATNFLINFDAKI